jgi:hypothetical protein
MIRRAVDRPGQVLPEGDDSAARLAETQTRAVVAVRASPSATKGGEFYAAITVTGAPKMALANIVLAFDPAILEVKSVRNSGLMAGTPVFTVDGGAVTITMKSSDGAGAVAANGQLALIVFTVKEKGTSELTLTAATRLDSSEGASIPLTLQSASIEAK